MSTPIQNPPVEPPEQVYVRQRYIPREIVDWVMECDEILMRYGLVRGSMVYIHQHTARNKAARLIRYMDELRVHERWELKEHTERRDGGWAWSVEYVGGRKADRGRPEET